MWGRRSAPAIDCVVMARFRGQPVNLYLHNGHRIDGGVVRHVGTATVEVLRNTGAAVVDLAAIAVVESLVPESAWAEFPLPGEDRTGRGMRSLARGEVRVRCQCWRRATKATT